MAYALTTLASCFSVQKGCERKAFPILERAVKIIEGHYGQQCMQLAEPGGPLVLQSQIQEIIGHCAASFRTLKRIADIRGRNLPPDHQDILDIAREIQRLQESMKSPERRHSFSALAALLREREDRRLCSLCRSKLDGSRGGAGASAAPAASTPAPQADGEPPLHGDDEDVEGNDATAGTTSTGAERAPIASKSRALCAACTVVSEASRLDRMCVTRARSKANVTKWRQAVTIARLSVGEGVGVGVRLSPGSP